MALIQLVKQPFYFQINLIAPQKSLVSYFCRGNEPC